MKTELIKALKSVRNGADIFSYVLAKQLREIEKNHPEFICICDAQFDYDGAGQLPYFGAITTAAGNAFLSKQKVYQSKGKS